MMHPFHSVWQHEISHAVTDIHELCRLLNISAEAVSPAIRSFPLRVPRSFIARMEKGNPRDPLLLQVIPQLIELQKTPGFSKDPLIEKTANPIPGLLHKYTNRVLLTLTGGCAVNCRYCFRRHFSYEDNLPSKENFQRALSYIEKNTSIEEIIFSGGDPLILKDEFLMRFVTTLEKIEHISRLRIHTRVPIVVPSRLTKNFIRQIKKLKMDVVIVVHANHPNEIDETVTTALRHLKMAGITVLNQSVLLKDINDNAEVLAQLSKKLFSAGVLPYYLHALDKVDGSAHFEVPEDQAQAIMASLKQQLPGFLVPKFAREAPGEASKIY